ncbi:MAG: hypothetical protein JF887_14205 [Candidatus Dormibacteraeota bacterium]|uniref:Uncharacterized protein n=1 Tax=Candidatus Amunia macphersoniae TaxID=3127014 RepID=A0A934KG08_9BACT|nr:hypothetical protein [Candidatus Dormibacteraeota bacterium]
MTTPITRSQPARHLRLRRSRRVLAVGGAAASTLAVWAVANRFAGLEVRLGAGSSIQHIGPLTIVVVSILAGLLAWAVLALFERFVSRRAHPAWVALALAVLVGSLAGPLGAGTSMATKVALVCMHLAAAAVLIPALAARTS